MAHPAGREDANAPPFRRLLRNGSSRVASQKLTASLENVEADLEYRLRQQPELHGSAWEITVRAQLDTVQNHRRRGEIDAAWRCLSATARRELEKADEDELRLRATSLRHEAKSGKLSSPWRGEAIIDLLETGETEGKPPNQIEVRRRVTEATRLRDEDDENRYYKVALVRGQRSLLLVLLLLSIGIILGLAAPIDWEGDLDDPSAGFVALVAAFGALGACLSAIQSLGRAGGRVPEHVAASLITVTRPTLGAAAALGVYAIAASGLLSISLEDEGRAHLTILALAFAAGFSERLVLSAVGAATGSTGQKGEG